MIRFKIDTNSVSMEIKKTSVSMTVEKAAFVSAEGNAYQGSYEITPDVDGQTMETKQKYMKDDVTIHPIPYFDVSNNSGGSTVYIGSEVLTNGNF